MWCYSISVARYRRVLVAEHLRRDEELPVGDNSDLRLRAGGRSSPLYRSRYRSPPREARELNAANAAVDHRHRAVGSGRVSVASALVLPAQPTRDMRFFGDGIALPQRNSQTY